MSDAWNPGEHYKNPKVAESYDQDRFSGVVGATFNWLEKRALRRALGDLPRDFTIADVPCGTGRLAEVALERGHNVMGIDVSDAMLSVARRRLERFGDRFATRVEDASEIGKAGPAFDVVLSARFLTHFTYEQQTEFVRSFARAARKRVILGQGRVSRYHRMRRAIKRLAGWKPRTAFGLSPTQLDSLLRAAALRKKKYHRVLPLVSESVLLVAEPEA